MALHRNLETCPKPFSFTVKFAGENETGTAQVKESSGAECSCQPGSETSPARICFAKEKKRSCSRVHEQPQNVHNDPDSSEHTPTRPPSQDSLRIKPVENETWQKELAGKQHSLPEGCCEPQGALFEGSGGRGRQQLWLTSGISGIKWFLCIVNLLRGGLCTSTHCHQTSRSQHVCSKIPGDHSIISVQARQISYTNKKICSEMAKVMANFNY